METLIKKLKMATPNYVASTYPNPGEYGIFAYRSLLNVSVSALAFFYAKLQSIAFEEPTFDATAVDDKSLPLYDGIHKVSQTTAVTMLQFSDDCSVAAESRSLDAIL